MSREELASRWVSDRVPDDPRDDDGIKSAVGSREKLLRRTGGLGREEVEAFGRYSLLACRDQVVAAIRSQQVLSPGELRDLCEYDDDPVAILGRHEHPHALLGGAS